jgi:hypothetical protein
MNCKPDDEQDRDLSIAKRQSEDDEDSSVAMDSSSVAMVEELLSSEYDTEEGGNLPAEHAPHSAPHPASHPAKQDLHLAPQPAEQDPHPAPQPAKRWKKYPLKDITEPHEHDVLCGRGGEYSVCIVEYGLLDVQLLVLNFFCSSLQDIRINTKVIRSIGRWLKVIKKNTSV